MILGAIGVLMGEVVARMETLQPSQADNLEWTLSQVEVEFLMFEEATTVARMRPGADLAPVLKRFELFDARLRTVRVSPHFAVLRADPEGAVALSRIGDFASRMERLVDGPRAELRAALPGLGPDLAALRPDVQMLAQRGLAVFARQTDARQAALGRTLMRLAGLTLVLILALVGAVAVLARLNRLNDARMAELTRTRARLQTILATALDAVLVTDAKGRVMVTNRAAEAMFGLSDAEMRGRPMSMLAAPAGATGDAALPEAIGPGRRRLEGRRVDGSRFPAEVALAAAEGQEGGEGGAGPLWIATIRDVSDQDAAARDLRDARDRALAGERAKAEFLAVMSHEMRTPLNGLLGTIELLAQSDLAPKQAEYVKVMQASGRHLLRHVNDVLDIARAEADRGGNDLVAFDIATLFEELAAGQRSLAEASGNRLVLDLPTPPLPPLMGDPPRLRKVLLNLLGNAMKFTHDGTITLTAHALEEGGVELSVADTGIGIAPGDQAKIFSDFVTLDASYRRNVEGTGLGLGIARRMVEAMGGEIGVDSTPGKGARFWLRLPLAQAESAVLQLTEPEALPVIAPREVLLVEDNRINRFVVREMLEGMGHRVTEAVDGHEGVALAAKWAFDLILMDISMPRMDGVEAARAIRAGGASAKAPIVALTAHAQPSEHARFREAGMTESLTKPVTRVGLARLLARLSGGAVPSATPAAASGLVDTGHLAELTEQIGPDQLPGLVAVFFQEGDDLVSQPVPPAGLTGEALAEALHRLAGSAAIFGARELQARLNRAEIALRAGEEVPDWPGLVRLWQATRAEYDALLGERDTAEDAAGGEAEGAAGA